MQQVPLSTATMVAKEVLSALGAFADTTNQRHRDVALGAQAAVQLLLAALCRSIGFDYAPVLAQLPFAPEVANKSHAQLESVLLGLQLTDNTKLSTTESPQRPVLEELLQLLALIQRDAFAGPDRAETVTALGGAQVVEGVKIGTTNMVALLAIALAGPLNTTIPDAMTEVGLGDMPPDMVKDVIRLLAGYKEKARAEV